MMMAMMEESKQELYSLTCKHNIGYSMYAKEDAAEA